MNITLVINNEIGYSICIGHGQSDITKIPHFSQLALITITKELYYTDKCGSTTVEYAKSLFDSYCFFNKYFKRSPKLTEVE